MSLYALELKLFLVCFVGKVPCSTIGPWDGLVNPFNGWLEGLRFVILATGRVRPCKSFNTDSSSPENGG